MTNNPTVALDLATVIALTLVTVSILKGLVEVWVSPAARLHDPLIQLLALLCGVGWSFVLTMANGPVSREGTVQAIVSVILGLSGGAGSIGAYHTSTALKGTSAQASVPPAEPTEQAPVGPSVLPPTEPAGTPGSGPYPPIGGTSVTFSSGPPTP